MRPASYPRISEILVNWAQGDSGAREALIPPVYDELRRIARCRLRGERPNHTLQSVALVHEAYVRLVHLESPQWQNRADLELDDAVNKLAALDPGQSHIIEMRFFGGLSIEETATVLDISPATVKREWTTARAWLQRETSKDRGT